MIRKFNDLDTQWIRKFGNSMIRKNEKGEGSASYLKMKPRKDSITINFTSNLFLCDETKEFRLILAWHLFQPITVLNYLKMRRHIYCFCFKLSCSISSEFHFMGEVKYIRIGIYSKNLNNISVFVIFIHIVKEQIKVYLNRSSMFKIKMNGFYLMNLKT